MQYFFDRQVVDYGKQVDCGHLFVLGRGESAFIAFPSTDTQAILEGVRAKQRFILYVCESCSLFRQFTYKMRGFFPCALSCCASVYWSTAIRAQNSF